MTISRTCSAESPPESRSTYTRRKPSRRRRCSCSICSAERGAASEVPTPGFVVLILDPLSGSGLQAGQGPANDALAQFEHDRLLPSLLIQKIDSQKMPPLFRQQQNRRNRDGQSYAASG